MQKKAKQFYIAPKHKPSKTAELAYQRQLTAIITEITAMVKKDILPVLKAHKGVTLDSSEHLKSYIADGVISDLVGRFAVIQTLMNYDGRQKERVSGQFVGIVGESAETNIRKVAERSGFVLPQNKVIVESQGMTEALDIMTEENVALIKDIGQTYLDKIKRAVLDNYLTGKFEGKGGILKELQKIKGINKRRAKLIARDQSSKIYNTVSQLRAQRTGAIGYKWDNSGDERVRGNPNGKYPDVKQSRNHWIREGKFYLWKPSKNPPIAPDGKPFRQPPADGGPGFAYNCRCLAQPVWELEI